MNNFCSFKKSPTLIFGFLGICWAFFEHILDIFTLSGPVNFSHELYHVLTGGILGYLMRLTYLRSKKSKIKYIQDLRSSEERYRMIFDNSPLGIFHFDQTGKIIRFNDKLIEILGASREQLTGFNMLTQVNDVNLREAMETALEGKVGHYEGIYTAVTSGKTLQLKALFNSINSESGEFLGGVGTYEDISEKSKMEKELARLDRLDLVGQMSASIGHEIRNPMTTVRGFLQLLGNQEMDLFKKDYYEVMINELDRANLIITEFLSLAKNKLVKFENVSINDIIDSIFPLILVDALKQDKNIVLNKGEVPRMLLDEREIRQLIFNLVRNGLEAMPKGKNLTIRTYISGEELVLTVQDEGFGISNEIIDRLGTPFVTTKEAGTGLGLPVCYSIAERHKAKIDIKTGSSGTTFFVRFKLTDSEVSTKKAC